MSRVPFASVLYKLLNCPDGFVKSLREPVDIVLIQPRD